MKTALFAPCYLIGVDKQGNDRFERQKKWLNWYLGLQNELGFDHIFLSDNASSFYKVNELESEFNDKGVTVLRHTPHLTGCGHANYPYCWRHLYAMKSFLSGYQKVIAIDTDAFVVSKRLADYIKALPSGWVAFQERKYEFPTAECHILCEDSFWLYHEFTSIPYMAHMGKVMEHSLPFTHVETAFFCERSGEEKKPQADTQDLYCQANLDTELIFRS